MPVIFKNVVFISCLLAICACSRSVNRTGTGDHSAVVNVPQSLQVNSPALQAAGPGALDIKSVSDILVAPVATDAMAQDLVVTDSQAQLIETRFIEAFRLAAKTEIKGLSDLIPSGLTSSATGLVSNQEVFSLARKNNISSVLVIRVNKLQERTGASFGSDKLAMLGLNAQIYNADSPSGQDVPVWRGGFDYTDTAKPLISFEDGKLASLGFKTLDDLVKQAASQVATNFADARQKAFAK